MDGTPSPGHPDGNRRLLVIDDDPAIGYLLQLTLEFHGYDVVTAGDGSAGLAAAQDQRPDAIVLDLMMPVMDGFKVLEELRADHRTHDVPVVVLSAVTDQGTRERVEAAGARAFVAKPFDADRLAEAVASVVVAGET